MYTLYMYLQSILAITESRYYGHSGWSPNVCYNRVLLHIVCNCVTTQNYIFHNSDPQTATSCLCHEHCTLTHAVCYQWLKEGKLPCCRTNINSFPTTQLVANGLLQQLQLLQSFAFEYRLNFINNCLIYARSPVANIVCQQIIQKIMHKAIWCYHQTNTWAGVLKPTL